MSTVDNRRTEFITDRRQSLGRLLGDRTLRRDNKRIFNDPEGDEVREEERAIKYEKTNT